MTANGKTHRKGAESAKRKEIFGHSVPLRCICALLVCLLFCCACRRGLFDDSKYRPFEANAFFPDGNVSRPLLAHTVPRGHLEADDHVYRGKIGTNLVETFPFPITRDVLERGRERYDIYCSVCHGRTGEANGMVVQRGFPVPPSFHVDRLRDAPVGHLYDVITHGYGVMYPYASRVEVADRWAIAAYIRALQLSQHARLEDLPQSERAQLKP